MINKIKNSSCEIIHAENFDHIYKKFGYSSAPEYAKKIIEVFNKNNSTILISGGFVRDVYLKKLPSDIDFVTDLIPESVENLLKEKFQGEYKKLELQGKTFGVIRIIFNSGENYEIATFRKDGNYTDGIHPDKIEIISNPQEDSKRRDFTINALFYDPIKSEIIDCVSGIDDLENKKLRFVGDPDVRIGEDKSRMLRYVRFLIKTGFNSEKRAEISIKKHADQISIVPRELIKKELDKAIEIDKDFQLLELLDRFELLKYLFPDIKNLENCKQGPPFHLEGDALIHTKLVYKNLQNENPNAILKWASIFHDIGKFKTEKIEIINGKKSVSFPNHDKVGARITKKILKDFKFNKYDVEKIVWLVENHLIVLFEIGKILKNNKKEIAREKLIIIFKKYIKLFGEEQVLNLLKLGRADSNACIFESGPVNDDNFFNIVYKFIKLANNDLLNDIRLGIIPEKIINGKLIMNKLQISSGKKIGQIKKFLMSEVLNKRFLSKKHFISYVEKLLEKFK